MSSKPASPPRVAPDRLFDRATGIVMAVGLVMVLGVNLAVERALQRQAAAGVTALVAAHEAASVRAVIVTLGRLSALPEGPERQNARSRLAWEVEELVAGEGRRLASAGETGAGGAAAGLLRSAEEAMSLARQPKTNDVDVGRLTTVFEVRLLPQIERIAGQEAEKAVLARDRARWVLAGSLVTQVLGVAALLFGVVRPARRRIAAWVEESDETDRENRFRLLHDSLTRMPNGTYLHAYLNRIVEGAERREGQTAVVRIDLDRFLVLRETLGKARSDEIIRIAARRIQHALRPDDFAAYLGDSNFVVVTGDLEDANTAVQIAGRVQQALLLPFSIRGGARRISCSIGLTLISDAETTESDMLLANAGIALSEAKNDGPGNIRYFREDLRREMERRETLYTELSNGLETGEVVAFFQPQIDLATGNFCGFEALVRWHHPTRGLLAPGAFLDFADETDLTERIGEVVLTRSLEALKAWEAEGLDVPKVGVNFALVQLRDPRLIEKIKWEVERLDIEPRRLSLEVLETVLIKSDQDLVVRNLRGLASAGFGIELDDFGTGHASISNLRRFMVNRIKIDRGFVFGIEESEELQQLTASMIAMAHALGIKVLAEGVETMAAEAKLRDLGCDYFQGFLVARPMSLDDTMSWLRSFETRSYPACDAPRSQAGGRPNTP